MIKAIETRYKGYRFRSRLEARWAVFFDVLGLAWEYEPEGFEFEDQPFRETDGGMSFSNGGRYLPDFLVTCPGRFSGDGSTIWCEVKPQPLNERERELCELLVINTDRSCGLLVGVPDFRAYECLHHREGYLGVESDYMLLWSTKRRFWWTSRDFAKDDVEYHIDRDAGYIAAVHAARSARFEYGEQGR